MRHQGIFSWLYFAVLMLTLALSGCLGGGGGSSSSSSSGSGSTTPNVLGTWKWLSNKTNGTTTDTSTTGVTVKVDATTFTFTLPASTTIFGRTFAACTEIDSYTLNNSVLTETVTSSMVSGSMCDLVSTVKTKTVSVSGSTMTVTTPSTGEVNTFSLLASPAQPSATASTSGGISISWQAISGTTSYNVYRGTVSGALATKTKVGNVTTGSYLDATVNVGTTYYYQITAVYANGESAPSSEVQGYATVAPLPSRVVGLGVITGNGQATLSWNAVTGATSYNVYNSTTPGVTKLNGTQIANVTSPQTFTNMTNGTTYYFVVTAVNSAGESAESAQISVTPYDPSVPQNLTVTKRTNGGVDICLISSTSKKNIYIGTAPNVATIPANLETSLNNTIWSATTPSCNTIWSTTRFIVGTTYYFKATSVTRTGVESIGSNEVSLTY